MNDLILDCKNNAFGVADKRKIPDAQMSAYLSQSTYLASNGRYGGGSYWCGANNNAWLQIDLGTNAFFNTGMVKTSYSMEHGGGLGFEDWDTILGTEMLNEMVGNISFKTIY